MGRQVKAGMGSISIAALACILLLCCSCQFNAAYGSEPEMSSTRVVFQVDKGFVAQVADVVGGRTVPMNEEQWVEAEKTVKGEFSDVKHVRGILSMGRYSDPDSASSSFSMLLGDAPHLDGQYAVFGKVTKGDETLRKLEQLPTRREGIFVMPTERITILSTYYYDTEMESCEQERSLLKRRLAASAVEIERQRMKCFP